MHRWLLSPIFAIIISHGLAHAEEPKSVKILDGKIEVSIPSDFTPMTEEIKRIKYPTGTPPQEVFTDESGGVNIAATRRPVPESSKLEDMLPAIADMISKIRNIKTWHEKGIREINGAKFAFMEFTSPAIDTDVYNYIYFTVRNGEMMMLTVNCTVARLPVWKEQLHKAVSSTRLIASE